MNASLFAAAEQWAALLLTLGVIAAALGAVTARSLFAMAMYLAAACALATAALLALTKPDAALVLALLGVGVAPFLLLAALLLSARAIKPRRGRPWLMLSAAGAVGAAVFWAIPDMAAMPTRIAMRPDVAPHLPVAVLIAPLVFVAAIACLALLGFGERGALEPAPERGR